MPTSAILLLAATAAAAMHGVVGPPGSSSSPRPNSRANLNSVSDYPIVRHRVRAARQATPGSSAGAGNARLNPADQTALRVLARQSGPGVGLNHPRCRGWDVNPCAQTTDYTGCLNCDHTNTTITRLYLKSTGMVGAIPAGVCDLTGLTILDLYSNELTGNVLPCIGRLVNLKYLDLDTNRLSGAIPTELCDLSALAGLYLYSNELTGAIPPCIGGLRNLNDLELNVNRLSGAIPVELCTLTALEFLDLDTNELAGEIPACISHLVNLTFLDFRSNRLSGDPFAPITATPPTTGGGGICAMPWLKWLDLSDNPGLVPGPVPGPDCLCHMQNLTSLKLTNTARNGAIPACLNGTATPFLVNLTLASNPGLTGRPVPASLCGLRYLQSLFLQDNPGLAGPLPACIGELTNLKQLDLLKVPRLDGDLPPELLALPKLKYLLVSGARGFGKGGLPQALVHSCPFIAAGTGNTVVGERRCPQVSPYNQYGRTIATTFLPPVNVTNGATLPWLPAAKLVAIVGCGLGGVLPAWLVNLANITAIDLSGNELSGPLPTVTNPRTNLSQFAAANNRLTGTLEALAGASDTILQLDISSNVVGGVVPAWLAARSAHMTTLNLFHNQLSCGLPALAINGSGGSGGVLRVLSNNVFGCPIPRSVDAVDPDAATYNCGSHALTTALGYVSVVAAIYICGGFCLGLPCQLGTTSRAVLIVTPSKLPSAQFKFGPQYRRASVVVALLFVTTLVPTYWASAAVVECRFGWKVTAAYLVGNGAPWVWVMLMSGGLGGGAAICWFLLVPALRQQRMSTHAQGALVLTTVSSDAATTARWPGPLRLIAAALVALAWALVNVALNVVFVLEEDSPSLGASGKGAVVLVFGLVHEVFDHLVSPRVVKQMVLLTGGRAAPSTMHTLVVFIELIASVVAPLIALVLASDACLLPLVRPGSVAPTVTAVDRGFCAASNTAGTKCLQFGKVSASVAYTPEFKFSGERCISSIITLYTPAYLTVFAFRTLLLPALWLLQRKFPELITPGLGNADGAADTSLGDGATSGQPNLSLAVVTQRLRERIEHNTFGINTTAIGLCAGLASPVIAVAAAACLSAKSFVVPALDRWHDRNTARQRGGGDGSQVAAMHAWLFPLKPSGGAAATTSRMLAMAETTLNEPLLADGDGDDVGGGSVGDYAEAQGCQAANERVGQASPPAHAPDGEDEAPPPPTAFVLMLFFHTVYAALLLFAGGLKWGGAAVAAANSAGVMALYRHHRRPKPIIA